MVAETNVSIVRRSWERYEAQDIPASRACFGETFVAHVAGWPADLSLAEYVEQGRIWLDAFPDFAITIEDEVATGDRVVIQARIRGTHRGTFFGIPATGKTIEVGGIIIDRVVDGQIIERRANWDLLGMLQQLGLMPPLTFAETAPGRAMLWLATKPGAIGTRMLGEGGILQRLRRVR